MWRKMVNNCCKAFEVRKQNMISIPDTPQSEQYLYDSIMKLLKAFLVSSPLQQASNGNR